MNELNSESMRSATRDYAQQIAVPEFDERPVRARVGQTTVSQPVWRRAAIATAAAAVVIVVALNGHAVVAQVEDMMRAVLTVGGSNVPATVRLASLQQAQRDMPFTVIAPPQIPGYRQSIQEIVAPSAPQSSRLLIQYTVGTSGGPPVTIMESSANATAPTQLKIWQSMRPAIGSAGQPEGQPPSQPVRPAIGAPGPQEQAELQVRGGAGKQFRVRVTPQTWTVGGTRIDLLTPPDALTPAQIDAIRREMSR